MIEKVFLRVLLRNDSEGSTNLAQSHPKETLSSRKYAMMISNQTRCTAPSKLNTSSSNVKLSINT